METGPGSGPAKCGAARVGMTAGLDSGIPRWPVLENARREKDIWDPRLPRDDAVGRERTRWSWEGLFDETGVAATRRQESDSAVVIRLVRIVVKPLVQRLPGRRRDDEHQHRQHRSDDIEAEACVRQDFRGMNITQVNCNKPWADMLSRQCSLDGVWAYASRGSVFQKKACHPERSGESRAEPKDL